MFNDPVLNCSLYAWLLSVYRMTELRLSFTITSQWNSLLNGIPQIRFPCLIGLKFISKEKLKEAMLLQLLTYLVNCLFGWSYWSKMLVTRKIIPQKWSLADHICQTVRSKNVSSYYIHISYFPLATKTEQGGINYFR